MHMQEEGRIGILFETLQDRFVAEMGIRGITDIDRANSYLKDELIADFDARFGVAAQTSTSGGGLVPV
ncbi:MAG: hypothetical protein N3B12_09360 [Armatimonadetes bacterium]|nr:hypothetical protein [Armatimonadota bacterium]